MEFIKQTLKKPSDQRSDFALDKLAVLIKQVKFFKDKSDLSKSDIRELASLFKFDAHRGLDTVFNFGDTSVNKFYIILRGIVSVQIPNPTMKDRF